MKGKQIRTNSGLEGLKLAKLIELTGKAISGEWGDDDDTGNGIPVLRTTNFTNDGIINYDNVVTRTIGKSNIEEFFNHISMHKDVEKNLWLSLLLVMKLLMLI